MFERYTENARRVIFFARYEASQFGSPEIEPEHLLLGVVRQSPEMKQKLNGDVIREAISHLLPHGKQISTSIDLPLSPSAKQVLTYSAEEAERLSHDLIDVSHLVLGLLREETGASRLIREAGCTLESLRKEIADTPPATVRTPGGAGAARFLQMLRQAGLLASREEIQKLVGMPEKIRELETVLVEVQISVFTLTQEIHAMNEKLDRLLDRGK